MNCPKCNTPLPDGSKFCGFCGTPVEEEELTKLIDEKEVFPPPFPAENRQTPENVNAVYAQKLSRPQHQAGGYVVGDGYYDGPQRGVRQQEEPEKKKKSRKPLIISIVAFVLVAAIAAGLIIYFSNHVSEAELKEAKENYRPPAEAVQIDLTKADPSNENIKFEYDDRARITSCVYSVNNKQYEQSYDYDDRNRSVHITVDYKKNHILTQDISYDKVQKPNEFEVIEGQVIRLDNESLYGGKDDSSKSTESATQAVTDAPTDAPTQPPTEAPTNAPTEPPTQAPSADFRDLYLAFLDVTDINYDSGELIYLNDDDIPELVLNTMAAAGPSYVCYISDGTVHVFETYSTAGFSYSERNGYFATGAMHQGYLAGMIYYFDGSEVSTAHSYSSHDNTFSIDQTPVSEEEYNDVIDSCDLTGPSYETSKSSLPDVIRNFG